MYQPWLFDSREAWEQATRDPRWSYEMTLSQFMNLYAEHRFGRPSKSPSTNVQTEISPAALEAIAETQPSAAGEILDQSEIDNLLSSLT